MRSLQLKYSVHLYCRMPFIYIYIYMLWGVFLSMEAVFSNVYTINSLKRCKYSSKIK